MPKSLHSPPPLRRTADHYALRAHLVLDAARNERMTVTQAGELGCYLETAWQGAVRWFKSPPNKLLQAKQVMVDLLNQCQQETDAMAITEQQWQCLCDGLNCADGVWQRLSAHSLLEAMHTIRQAINHED